MSLLMLQDVSKELFEQNGIKNVNLSVAEGESVALQCDSERASLLLDIITGRRLPTKGQIQIFNENPHNIWNEAPQNVGVFEPSQGLYTRIKVRQYLRFFQKMTNTKQRIEIVLQDLGLQDKEQVVIGKLTKSQQRRLSIGRVLLTCPKLLLLREPTVNIDTDSAVIIRKSLNKFVMNPGCGMLLLTPSYEEAVALGSKVSRLTSQGVRLVDTKDDDDQAVDHLTMETRIKVEKIPAKVDSKIVLFNPLELMYIETREGTAYLHTEKEQFSCPLTLTELEERLKPFGFFRSHRSYLVNLQRVCEVIPWSRNSYSLILDDNNSTSLPLSKGRVDELKSLLRI